MLNVGIIGAGRIGKVHAESISRFAKGAVVKAIADPFLTPETIAWAKGLGIETTTRDHREILQDSSIQAVLICSSTDTHSPLSLEAIAAGKHIFCEKPIDHDVAKIEEVIHGLEGTGLKYQVGFNRRFDHNFIALQNAVLQGKVGTPEIIRITSRDPAPPPIEYVKVSGGLFLDMAIHDFDMARFLAGCEVEEVYVQAAVMVDAAIGEAGDVDTAITTLKMQNGALVVIDNCRRCAYGYDQRAEVFGSLGAVSCANDTASSAQLATAGGVTGEKPLHFFLERYMRAYTAEIEAFVEAVQNDTPVPVNQHDGLMAVLVGLAAKKSAQEHRPVKLAEISGV